MLDRSAQFLRCTSNMALQKMALKLSAQLYASSLTFSNKGAFFAFSGETLDMFERMVLVLRGPFILVRADQEN